MPRLPVLSFLLLVVLVLVVDFFSSYSFPEFSKKEQICRGIISEVRPGEERLQLLIAVTRCAEMQNPPQHVLATLGEGMVSLHPRDQILFRIRFRTPTRFQNLGSFHYTRYLHSQNIDATGFISDSRWISLMQTEPLNSLEQIRRRLKQHDLQIQDLDVRHVVEALLLGDQRQISSELYDLFRKTGSVHFLSISGLHVGVIFFFSLLLFRGFVFFGFVRRWTMLELAYLFALLPTWFYVALAHFPIPAQRAAVMATLFSFGKLLRLRFDAVSVVFLAAFFLLCMEPLSFFQIGFQLSFTAVFSIVWILQKFPPGSGWRGWLQGAILTSLAATLSTTPLVLWHFHEISFAGLWANFILIPLFSFLWMPLLVLGFVGSGVFSFSLPLLWKATEGMGLFWIGVVRKLALFSENWNFYGAVSVWQIILYFFAFFLFFIFSRKIGIRKWIGRGIALFLWLVVFGSMFGKTFWRTGDMLQVHFLDVGQGDASVIEFPTGEVWVIDGGGIRGSSFDMGRFVVAPFLWERGIRTVDRVFLTHPHHDHYRGLEFVLRHFSPRELWVNGEEVPEEESEDWIHFQQAVEETQVSVHVATAEKKPLIVGDAEWRFLLPEKSGPKSFFDVNDNSIVGQLRFGSTQFFFSGDLMESGERLLLKEKKDFHSTVLKVGHHGSKTSTTEYFLKQIRPEVAVISLGKYNRYGFPDRDVVERLEQGGAKIFRTDERGQITIQTDGNSVKIRTFVE